MLWKFVRSICNTRSNFGFESVHLIKMDRYVFKFFPSYCLILTIALKKFIAILHNKSAQMKTNRVIPIYETKQANQSKWAAPIKKDGNWEPQICTWALPMQRIVMNITWSQLVSSPTLLDGGGGGGVGKRPISFLRNVLIFTLSKNANSSFVK